MSKSRVPAMELKDVSFPACAGRCAAIEYLGASECEAVCPFKFDKEGDPLDSQTYVYRFRYSGGERLVEFKTFGVVNADRMASRQARELRDVGHTKVSFEGPLSFSGDVYGKSRFMLGQAVFLGEDMGKLSNKWFVRLSNNGARLLGSWPHGLLCTGRDEGRLVEVFLLSEREAEFVRFL